MPGIASPSLAETAFSRNAVANTAFASTAVASPARVSCAVKTLAVCADMVANVVSNNKAPGLAVVMVAVAKHQTP